MNILLVSQYFWPENFTINQIAKSLNAKGHRLDVLTGKPNYPEGEFFKGYRGAGVVRESWNGIDIIRIPILKRRKASVVGLFLNYLSFIFSATTIAPFALRKKEYDVIFVYAPSPLFQVIPAIFLGWLKSVPVVLWVQDLWPESLSATGYVRSKIFLKFLTAIVKFCYLHVDKILVQSQAFIQPVKELAPSKNIEFLPNSVDDSFFEQEKHQNDEFDSFASGFSVVFAGNIGSAQSLETIVEAAIMLQHYRDIKIVLFGSGSKVQWLENSIRSLGLTNLVLGGFYPNEMMPSLMSKASALLVSLKSDPVLELTIPNKIQAYLAVGKPIIGSLNGEGARVIFNSKAGLVAPAGDSELLVEKILTLYSMSDKERACMGASGKKFFKNNFSQSIVTDRLIDFLTFQKK